LRISASCSVGPPEPHEDEGEPPTTQLKADELLDSAGAVGRPDGGHMTWGDHQHAAADLFRQLGCQADGAGSYCVVGGLAVRAAAIYWIKSGQVGA
jgi:hypothetical protein